MGMQELGELETWDEWAAWDEVDRRPDVTVRFEDPGPGLRGRAVFATSTVFLHPDLLGFEIGDTLTHELIHLDRGPAHGEPGSRYVEREERIVELLTAQRMIAFSQLLDAARWTDDLDELAFELWVHPDTVEIRLQHLADDERHELGRMVAERDGLEHLLDEGPAA